MLRITVSTELYDEKTRRFGSEEFYTLELEHSLASLSKWESKFEKPFLSDKDKTREEILWYIGVMIQDPNFPPEVFTKLSQDNLDEINNYISAKMTATWIKEDPLKKNNKAVITAEIIYYWMISLNIPFECQHWHLNRLLTLIRVCNEKNAPPKKMNPALRAQQQRQLNEERRRASNSNG